MNRELKVAAVLGILVVGFAAVMVLGRKQDAVFQEKQPVEDFADIDKEIAEQPHKPHLTGMESGGSEHAESITPRKHRHSHASHKPHAERSVLDNHDNHDEQNSWQDAWDPSDDTDDTSVSDSGSSRDWEQSPRSKSYLPKAADRYSSNDSVSRSGDSHSLAHRRSDSAETELGMDAEAEDVDFLNDSDEELYRDSQARGSSIPEPISLTKTRPPQAEDHGRYNQGWEGVEETASQPRRAFTGQGTDRGRTYVVQSGDTLSSISSRFLGKSSRSREIFEANRRVLKNPNRLRVGMKIKIPGGSNDGD